MIKIGTNIIAISDIRFFLGEFLIEYITTISNIGKLNKINVGLVIK